MKLKASIIIVFLIFIHAGLRSQDFFSYGSSNYSGVNQVFSNPAAIADNRLKLDIILTGLDVSYGNSWFDIKRSALQHSGSIFQPNSLSFPLSWQNYTPNVPDNVFKNLSFTTSAKKRALLLENRILLPSFMYSLDAKNSVAFNWSVRQMAGISGMSAQLSRLFEYEMDLNVTQNNIVQNKNLAAVQMSWAEYGFTYARVIKDNNQHFFKAGITPKILQGLESAYFIVRNLDFLFSTKGNDTYFNADFSYGHSANTGSPFKGGNPIAQFYHYVTKPSLGLDLGFVYEWRPDFAKYKHKTDATHSAWRKDLNKYKLKMGASLVDLGRIKFKKQGTYYDLNATLSYNDITNFYNLKRFSAFDSILRHDYATANGSNEFKIMLPTALNTQVDYSFNRFFYLNLSAHLTNFNKKNLYRVHNYSSVCFAPRFESPWADVSVPFTYNTLSADAGHKIVTGLNVRIGPLTIGSCDLKPMFGGDVSSFNFYAILKVFVPYKRIHDRDGDGVEDKKDDCPDIAGEYDLKGCPDADHDNVPDNADACPHQPGLMAFKGCPDTDGDGIVDGEDACPKEKGIKALKGCPDLDGDSIVDKDDLCPDIKGIKKFKGCPDTDNDGIQDKEDACPTKKGPAKFKGCPDTDSDRLHDGMDDCVDVAGPVENKGCPWPDSDKDGIIDRLDSCINLPGVAEYKGCPPPPVIAMTEKRIIEKAYSSLEFASGKDIIKPVSFPSLNELAKVLLNHKNEWKIVLSGHTDNSGTEAGNLILSEKRAKAVQQYLIKKGIPEQNIEVKWYGQSQNIADNATKQGQQKNRRVEMKVLTKEE